ncbi:MAG: hypothetical protein AAFO77_08355, partial [Pseudomonadota bacterium]
GHAADADVITVDDTFEKRWDWSGFQVGVQAGYGFAKDRITAGPPAWNPLQSQRFSNVSSTVMTSASAA